MTSEKQWIPLESNPDVLTRFGHTLGIPEYVVFSDVLSMDLLDMVPLPRYAVILLFPLTEKLSSTDPPTNGAGPTTGPSAPYFCRQTVANACGTIALLHAALNNDSDATPLRPGSFLQKFLADTADKTPDERAEALQSDQLLDEVHEKFATQGQTEAPAADAKVDLHFVCFVQKAGRLYELDGRKEAPVDHGACEEMRLLEGAAQVIQEKFMKLDPSEHRFTIMAMTASPQ